MCRGVFVCLCEGLTCMNACMNIYTRVLCMFVYISQKILFFGCQRWYVNESLQGLLRLKDLLRPYNGVYDLIQFDSIRNTVYRDKGCGQMCSRGGEKIIRFAYTEALWGEKEKESCDWSPVVCLKVPGCLCLAVEEKINIMSPNCLCVSLSSSLFSLHPLSLSPSHPTTPRQLLLCNQINCSPVAFGKCEINKRFASEVYSVIQSIGNSICPPQICCGGFPPQIPHMAPSVTPWPYLLLPCDPSGSKYPIYKSAKG